MLFFSVNIFSLLPLPWCPFCWLFSAFLCHCQNFPPDEDPPSWQLAPQRWSMEKCIRASTEKKGNVVFWSSSRIKKSLVIYPATCVAFIAWYCPPGRSCNPWWNRGLADIDTTRHNEHPGVSFQIVLIGSWHPGAETIVFSASGPGLSHAFGGLCLESPQDEDGGIGKVNQKFKFNINLIENISL